MEARVFPTLSFGDQKFTPQEMSARSAQVAGAMAAIGLKEGDTIALMLRNAPALMDDTLCATAMRTHCLFTLTCFSKLGTVSLPLRF
jgi:acyl-CoA synthetase (AMP-forming)/AMP-acid ligase II